MQTVKIGDVEYPWPEKSQRFIVDDNFNHCFVVSERECWWCWQKDKDRLPIIASVAVMHFENKAAVLEPKCRVPDKHMDMKTGVMTVENAEEIQSFWAYRQAAAQWRTLCKEI